MAWNSRNFSTTEDLIFRSRETGLLDVAWDPALQQTLASRNFRAAKQET